MDRHESPLWTPSAARIAASHLTAFTRLASTAWNRDFADYDAVWQTSIEQPGHFWSLVWDYCGVIGDKGDTCLLNGESMQSARFFPQAQLNYAENLLRRDDHAPALIFWGEDQQQRQLSWHELTLLVSRLQQAMQACGIQSGDRVAGWMANQPETVAAMLAASSIGAIWTSCSPDCGMQSTLERFGQTTPRLLFCSDGYWRNSEPISMGDKIAQLAAALPSLEQVVVVPYLGHADALAEALSGGATLEQFIAPWHPKAIDYPRFPFDHPLFILYSSGTSGKPKCIVHGAGGTLLQHMKEHQLHGDIHTHDRLFYLTSSDWMMWNWQVSALACGATLLLYDGSPFADEGRILWHYAAAEHATHFGVTAKFLDQARKLGQTPRQEVSLSALRTLFSTGGPLLAESYDWVYRAVKADLNLASISGGTDIISCFALGCPNLPVYRGEIQCRGLGMAVEVFDPHGVRLYQQKGELVCTRPFPSMPVAFWNDPDGHARRRAYFNHHPNIWSHGDFAEITEHLGLVIHGRSDAALNPGGVRIGTSEIYRQLEVFEDVEEALAVSQRWENDERVILFLRMVPGMPLNPARALAIKQHIREQTSPHHVPAHIIAVPDLPRTANGKLAELAVKNVLHGLPVPNLASLANPQALKLFENLTELKH